MKLTIEEVAGYLRETLHAPIDLEQWRGENGLPTYLRARYHFLEGTVGSVPILFLQADEELTPSAARKHEHALRQWWTGPMAFVLRTITARDRQRLVNENVAFVVPRNQIYLPMLGVSLTERFRQRTLDTDRLRPSAQVLLLHALSERESGENTPSKAAKRLGYTAMAMGQALNQLENAGTVRVRKIGRERVFELAGDPAEIWERAQPMLASPVKRRLYAAGALPSTGVTLSAGLSALAEYSELAGPRVPVVAVSSARAGWLTDGTESHELRSAAEADLQIEIWSYAPELIAGDRRTVDRLSLFLSLREDPDERVQSALEVMMRGVKW